MIKLVIPGKPVPLQRHRTGSRGQYLPARSREFREHVQTVWMASGRPSLGGSPFALAARFYGARPTADLDNLTKAILDALNTLAFSDDRQAVCFAGIHKIAADSEGPRTEIDLWASDRQAP